MGNENPQPTLNMLQMGGVLDKIVGGNNESKIGSSGKATTIYKVHCESVCFINYKFILM